MGATGPGALDGERDWRRTAMIAAPWGLAILLGVVGISSARGAPAPPAPAATAASDPGDPVAHDGGGGDEQVTDDAPRRADVPTAPALSAQAELAVLAVARAAMGTAGLADGEAGDRWPLAAQVSSLQAVSREHAVATVHGLVIEHVGDGRWQGPRPRAVAVLLRTVPEPAVVGRAWPLATPSTPTVTPDLRPVEDPDPSVVAPLDEAGWSVEEVTTVESSDDALLRVALRGTPPGEHDASDHVVWLLDAPGGPRLLPLTAHTETEELP